MIKPRPRQPGQWEPGPTHATGTKRGATGAAQTADPTQGPTPDPRPREGPRRQQEEQPSRGTGTGRGSSSPKQEGKAVRQDKLILNEALTKTGLRFRNAGRIRARNTPPRVASDQLQRCMVASFHLPERWNGTQPRQPNAGFWVQLQGWNAQRPRPTAPLLSCVPPRLHRTTQLVKSDDLTSPRGPRATPRDTTGCMVRALQGGYRSPLLPDALHMALC